MAFASKHMVKVSPSILSANFADFATAVRQLDDAGADLIHCDVMDGMFVRNITFGQSTIRDLRKLTRTPLDVHLMICDPIRYLDDFAAAGADILTVHAEACTHLHRAVQQIHALGLKAGVSLNPATSPEVCRYLMDDVDLILCMSVNPGFGGQQFIPATLDKLRVLREMIQASGRPIMLEVDGGVHTGNAAAVREAGADVLVAGSAVFSAPDMRAAIQTIRGC